jgi:hypothetical protein
VTAHRWSGQAFNSALALANKCGFTGDDADDFATWHLVGVREGWRVGRQNARRRKGRLDIELPGVSAAGVAGFRQGLDLGHRLAREDARGRASGLRKPGRPSSVMDDGLAALMVHDVDEHSTGRLADRIDNFFQIMQAGAKKAGEPPMNLPTIAQAKALYHRRRRSTDENF